MMEESFEFKDQIDIFTTLVGRKKNVEILKNKLEELKTKHKTEIKIYDTTFYQGKTLRYFMKQNFNLFSRWGIAWSFKK